MKTNVLLLLLVNFLWLSSTHAQLLTPLPDSTNNSVVENSRSGYYTVAGYAVRVTTGYNQMYDFYQQQALDVERVQEFWRFGGGYRFWDDFFLDLRVEQSFSGNSPEDVTLTNDRVLSLQERQTALHFLAGYRFWEKRHKSLIFHAGASWMQNRAEITERLTNQDFNFTTGNLDVSRGVRNFPIFFHRQAALHVALQLKFRYIRPRWWSRDVDMKVGFVSGLKNKSWTVRPGQALNIPNDNAQYFYISSVYYFFSK